MNKKCEKCKYRLIVDGQHCFFLGLATTRQLAIDERDEYGSFEPYLKQLIKSEDNFLKNDLDSHNNEECIYCKNKFRAEGSRKYLEEMLLVVNKRWESIEWKLTILLYIEEKYFNEFGSFWFNEDIHDFQLNRDMLS
ncbi:hypothetical protein AXY43_16045 [Clostridium sp. MF28]|uniref:hypothetical protein n=1 Tax=Clostridium TaxID=1485 RepID=UPI000CF9626F|nr:MULTISPECIES: hypothetical protein [Clostridium]AVK49387.1 hypothetical protein AXY43_16045 [Clostridium sp. MF28]PSM57996.1 hypothetical protein C4L39_09265 [Clostridium diolis]